MSPSEIRIFRNKVERPDSRLPLYDHYCGGRGNDGSVAIPLLFLMVALLMMTAWLIDLARQTYWKERIQTVLDGVLVSSLRVRDESLRDIANRWLAVMPIVVGGDENGIQIKPDGWETFQNIVAGVKRALPSYQGRISSVRNMTVRANGFQPDVFQVEGAAGFNLGLAAEKIKVWDEWGTEKMVDGAWIRRVWNSSDRLGSPLESSVLKAAVTVHPFTFWAPELHSRPWKLSVQSAGKINWDVDRSAGGVGADGNGGFPRVWSEALWNGQVRPFRFPYYWPEVY